MIKVSVFRRAGRECYECQWRDPITQKLKTKTTGKKTRKDALLVAGALQADLNAGRIDIKKDWTWKDLADQYESNVMASRADATLRRFQCVRNSFEKLIDPKMVSVIDAILLGRYQVEMRNARLAESTIKTNLVTLRSCLFWAWKSGIIREVPHVDLPKRVKKMKGRPITLEEFERMLSALPQCHLGEHVESWRFLLQGLWFSGLRLGEALALSWVPGSPISVNTSGERLRLKFEANADKSTKARILPITEDFAEFLQAIPKVQRRGKVFNPIVPDQVAEMRLDTAGKVISKIGKKAKVVVSSDPLKYASAHDLRRSFGTRWAKKLSMSELMVLMRHESPSTTQQFYVDHTVESLEAKTTNTPTNIPPVSSPATIEKPQCSQ